MLVVSVDCTYRGGRFMRFISFFSLTLFFIIWICRIIERKCTNNSCYPIYTFSHLSINVSLRTVERKY